MKPVSERSQPPVPAVLSGFTDPILDSFALPVLVAGTRGLICRLNPACVELLGDCSGAALSQVFPGVPDTFAGSTVTPSHGASGRRMELEVVARVPAGGGEEERYISIHEIVPQPIGDSGYHAFLKRSSEAIFRFELDEPVAVTLDGNRQVEAILRHARLVECSEAFARMQGTRSAAALAGLRLDRLLPPSDERNLEHLRRFVRGGGMLTGAEIRERTPGGERIVSAEWIGVVEDGHLRGIWGCHTDITAHRYAEQELKATTQRYRKLFETTNDILFTMDREGRITSTNTALEKLTGFQGAALARLDKIVAPEYRAALRELVEAPAASGQTRRAEMEFLTATGRRISLELAISKLEGVDEATALLGVARNMTGQRAVERFETGRRAILEMVAMDVPLEVVLERLTGIVELYFPGAYAALTRASAGRLYYVAGQLPEAFREAFAGTRVAPMCASCGTAAFLGRPVVASEIATDPTWSVLGPAAAAAGLRACWSAPVLATSGQLLGTLALYFDEPAESDPELVDLLHSAAHLAALTIEHREFTERLRHQATHDPVTGLANRYALETRLDEALAEAGAGRQPFSVVYIDLDRFKLVNDTYGHRVGDDFLRQVAMRLASCAGEGDLLARVGGDEFVLLLVDPAHRADSRPVLEALRQALETPVFAQGRELFVSISAGVSVYPGDGETAETLLSNADAALSYAKSEGKNTFRHFAPQLLTDTASRLELQNELHRALERGEFSLNYQPQFNLQNGRLVGREALLRWDSGLRGRVGPAEFIPIAEECGLIVPIGLWVLRHACRHAAEIYRIGRRSIRIAVNVSAVQLAQPDFVGQVAIVLEDTGLPPCLLELELTETALMRDHRESAAKIVQLRGLGVVISVDDFGTGYSSLSRLQQLPLDRLKIDLSFVREIRSVTEVPPIVQAIVALGHGLGINVLAEGVENRDQLRVLRDLGCNEAQGYLLGRPAPAGAVLVSPPGFEGWADPAGGAEVGALVELPSRSQ